MKIFYATLKAK